LHRPPSVAEIAAAVETTEEQVLGRSKPPARTGRRR
jgi:hypothetical protein